MSTFRAKPVPSMMQPRGVTAGSAKVREGVNTDWPETTVLVAPLAPMLIVGGDAMTGIKLAPAAPAMIL
ncbi:MAG: hypothetical protein J7521_20330 [Caulobacter sp.]|nr:hypothetical protein [Caulobacter sp.]